MIITQLFTHTTVMVPIFSSA